MRDITEVRGYCEREIASEMCSLPFCTSSSGEVLVCGSVQSSGSVFAHSQVPGEPLSPLPYMELTIYKLIKKQLKEAETMY